MALAGAKTQDGISGRNKKYSHILEKSMGRHCMLVYYRTRAILCLHNLTFKSGQLGKYKQRKEKTLCTR
jgi:hypothetical protein